MRMRLGSVSLGTALLGAVWWAYRPVQSAPLVAPKVGAASTP